MFSIAGCTPETETYVYEKSNLLNIKFFTRDQVVNVPDQVAVNDYIENTIYPN
jgi:hypothetical protein